MVDLEPIEVKPITSTVTKITTGSAVLLSILAIILNAGLLGEENVYVCLDDKVAIQCDKLSSVNDEGIQTRCYFTPEDSKQTYKNCKSGWLEYVPEIEKVKENISTVDKVYLLCEKKNELVSMCQIVDSNETIYQVGG